MPPSPRLSYIICATPRSGSTLLSSALWQTNVAGRPAEYCNPGLRDDILCSRGLRVSSDSEYLPAMIRASTTQNGVFGTKLHPFQTNFLLAKVAQHRGAPQRSLRAALESELPNIKYIFLTRENKTAQAVSYYRAAMTTQWFHWRGQPLSPEDAHLEFDHLGLEKCRVALEASDRYWENYFAAHSFSPLRLTYEELASDYAGVVRRALHFLELPSDGDVPPPATVRVADGRSLEWGRRYKRLGRLYTAEDADRLAKSWAPF